MSRTVTASDQADRFLEAFFRFFAAPSVASYTPLFHPDGTLQDAGMATPLPAAQTGEAIRLVLSKLPDLHITPVRHAARDGRVFVEARNRGTMRGQPLQWGALYRVHLKDARVFRGRRFYDQVELMKPILPADARLPAFVADQHRGADDIAPIQPPTPGPGEIIERLSAAWSSSDAAALAALYAPNGQLLAPGLDRPVTRADIPAYRRYLRRLFPDLTVRPVDWAGDGGHLFVEWRGTGSYRGAPAPLDRVERYLLDAEGRITESRAYFDTLALVERDHPSVAEIRAGVIKN